jgi:hypothetical protein
MRYVTKHSLPTEPRVCTAFTCIYSIEGGQICRDPRNNRGNSDAHCHKVSPREVMTWLYKPTGDEGTR